MPRERSKSKNRPATIKDVARLAGVSYSTVSRVVNDSKPVNEPTRQRVLEAVRELNYVPNDMARSLQMRESRTLGVMMPEIGSSGAAQILEGAESVARASGRAVMLMNTAAGVGREVESLSHLLQRQVDGIVWVASRFTETHRKWFEQHRLPVVVLAQDFTEFGLPSVLVDNTRAANDATEFILEHGHTEIAMISGDPDDRAVGCDRRNGYEAALEKHGIPMRPELVAQGDVSSQESGFAAMAQLAPHGPTAVLAASDILAMGAMRFALERGWRIPEDLSIMGFDDLDIASHPALRLSTVAFDFVELGATTTRMLIEAIERPSGPPTRRLVPHRVVERDTVGRR